nr:hypothetical protein [Tanacetum cinerariifolium]
MRRVGKGFSEVDTPLFDGMLVPQHAQDVEDAAENADDVNELILLWMVRRMHPNIREIAKLDADKDVTLENVDAEVTMDANETDEAKPAEVEEVIKVVIAVKLMAEVVTTAATTITTAPVPKASAPRRRRGVIIQDPEEAATRNQREIREGNIKEEGSKRKSEISEQRVAKNQRIDEEVEELNTHLQIVANDEDDVYTKANPLPLKVPVVDYQIYYENNKPFYKIIRADGTHKLFLSFINILKNFDREDLEMLWKLVQERFQSSEPKNFSDDFLLNTFKIMFEKPNVEASIWKDQRGRYRLQRIYAKGLLLLVGELNAAGTS